ncbi:hypothetical protein FLAG1_07388 [Fusarium langsethiae]|uniref:Uncharacterized protein n=1 Tax=Fusarium langsethiae TaxID=179993 RepID=A0A0N0DDI3_FUSLA|nr:hypothetical protein FLAG1_07388 [Fusarium langsethiae]
MIIKNNKFAFVALALTSFTPIVVSQNTPSENIVLADCGIGLGADGGSTSREVAMRMEIPWSGQYPWTQDGGLQFTMPNGDEFAVLIAAGLEDPNAAGAAHHSYDPRFDLICYSYHYDKVFQLEDGTWCSSAYVCNHRKGPFNDVPEPPKPEPLTPEPPTSEPPKPIPQKLEIYGSVNKDTVEIYDIPASHIMNTARDAFLEDAYKCDTTKRKINGKCTISWECDGDPKTKALEEMATVFDELATRDEFSTMREVSWDICRYPETRPGREGQCRGYETKVDRYYKMPGTIELTMRNVARPETGENSSVHGKLKYTIECEESTMDCFFCNTAGIIIIEWRTLLDVPLLQQNQVDIRFD